MYFCTRIRPERVSAKQKGSGFSAVGSAHVWGARGRWFESSNPDRSEGVENKRVSAPFLFLPSFHNIVRVTEIVTESVTKTVTYL